ncbi:MAG TPA: AraC family transcriptional regulator [Ktedonobacterales bacterium]
MQQRTPPTKRFDPLPSTCSYVGAANTLLHSRGRHYFWQGAGALSVKAFFAGQARYSVGAARYVVGADNYLVLNAEQPYTIAIDAAEPVESFCLFFAPGFAEHVQRDLTTPSEQLLDDPHAGGAAVSFFERTYPRDDAVFALLVQLRAATSHGMRDPGWIEEWYHAMMQRLLAAQRGVRSEVSILPGARAATREELYRRVHLARDYAAAMYAESVTLGDLAHVAALSPNHLLRAFRAAFGQSPHQYLTALRLEGAQQLLRTTDLPITQICLDVGFTSLGSFTTLFSRRVGCPPATYRLRSRKAS